MSSYLNRAREPSDEDKKFGGYVPAEFAYGGEEPNSPTLHPSGECPLFQAEMPLNANLYLGTSLSRFRFVQSARDTDLSSPFRARPFRARPIPLT